MHLHMYKNVSSQLCHIENLLATSSRSREAPWSSGYSSSAMVQKVAVSREFEARLRHAATGKLSLSTQQKMGTFFD